MSDDEDEYISCKVVLLGESGAGKTSILNKYIQNFKCNKYLIVINNYPILLSSLDY